MTVASSEVEAQIPVSVARVIVGGSASARGSGNRIVSGLSGNDAGAREVRPEMGNYLGLPREPDISLEIGNALTQFFSQEGLSPLVARLIRAVQQTNPAEEKVPPDAVGQYGLVGQWDVSIRETRNDPGGRVSRPDHQ